MSIWVYIFFEMGLFKKINLRMDAYNFTYLFSAFTVFPIYQGEY